MLFKLKDVTPSRIGIARNYPSAGPTPGHASTGGSACACAASDRPTESQMRPHALGIRWPQVSSHRLGESLLRVPVPSTLDPGRYLPPPRCCRRESVDLDQIALPGEYDALRSAFHATNNDFAEISLNSLRGADLRQTGWEGDFERHLMMSCSQTPNCQYDVARQYVGCITVLSSDFVTVCANSYVDCVDAGFPPYACEDGLHARRCIGYILPGLIDVFAGGNRIQCGSHCVTWALAGQPCPSS